MAPTEPARKVATVAVNRPAVSGASGAGAAASWARGEGALRRASARGAKGPAPWQSFGFCGRAAASRQFLDDLSPGHSAGRRHTCRRARRQGPRQTRRRAHAGGRRSAGSWRYHRPRSEWPPQEASEARRRSSCRAATSRDGHPPRAAFWASRRAASCRSSRRRRRRSGLAATRRDASRRPRRSCGSCGRDRYGSDRMARARTAGTAHSGRIRAGDRQGPSLGRCHPFRDIAAASAPAAAAAVRSHEVERVGRVAAGPEAGASELSPVGTVGRLREVTPVKPEERARPSAVRQDRPDLRHFAVATTKSVVVLLVLVGDPAVAAGKRRVRHRRRSCGDGHEGRAAHDTGQRTCDPPSAATSPRVSHLVPPVSG
jgi:hypothetical protein